MTFSRIAQIGISINLHIKYIYNQTRKILQLLDFRNNFLPVRHFCVEEFLLSCLASSFKQVSIFSYFLFLICLESSYSFWHDANSIIHNIVCEFNMWFRSHFFILVVLPVLTRREVIGLVLSLSIYGIGYLYIHKISFHIKKF